MLKKVLIGVAVALAVLLVVIQTQPSQLRVERSVVIAAPPGVVFPLIEDFRSWINWSPWEKLDPDMKRDYSGAPRGVGAGYAWSGNDDVGSGNMTITQSRPPEELQIRLEFTEPFAAVNQTVFAVTPEGQGSRLTWAMTAEQGFLGKAMCLFMDMDQMIGKDFETGLANVRALAEAQAKSAAMSP